MMLSIALLILLDAPRQHRYEWFELQRVGRLEFGPDRRFWGVTTKLSEAGAEIALTQTGDAAPQDFLTQPVTFSLADEALTLQGTLTQWIASGENFPQVTVKFSALSQAQHRRLVELLYCRPGQWKSRCAPNELHSLWLILKSVIKPRVVFDRKTKTKPIMVNPI
jgi:cellulose synthase (UDP-forming)